MALGSEASSTVYVDVDGTLFDGKAPIANVVNRVRSLFEEGTC